MEHDIHVSAGIAHRRAIANVGAHGLHAEGLQIGIASPGKRTHTVAPGDELFDDIASEESPGSGD